MPFLQVNELIRDDIQPESNTKEIINSEMQQSTIMVLKIPIKLLYKHLNINHLYCLKTLLKTKSTRRSTNYWDVLCSVDFKAKACMFKATQIYCITPLQCILQSSCKHASKKWILQKSFDYFFGKLRRNKL